MCEQTEINYLDGDVVWVKLGSCWWPGEVVGPDKLPPDVLPSFRKPPIAVVKFFQETTYEYVKNINLIYKYNCSRKNEFINKGLYMYRTKHGHMEKFPEDVIRAETAVGGDIEILTRDEFQEVKKESYAGLFGESSKRTPMSGKKGRGKSRAAESPKESTTPSRRFYKEKSDYKVHILVQPSKEPVSQLNDDVTPSTSRAGSETAEDKQEKQETPRKAERPSTVSTPTPSSAGTYACHTCSFTTTRLNVLVLHNKTHSATFTPYTPSPVRKKTTGKSPTKSVSKLTKTPKTPRPRKEKTEKAKKPAQGKKRTAEEKPEVEAKKAKTNQEIKSSLLADWDDDADDESNDESTSRLVTGSPEVPAGSESPAVPTPAELPEGESSVEQVLPEKKPDDNPAEKPECSSDSKYEFCEDEEWHVEADAGRKIPRVKNPSKRKEETKSLSLDEDEVAKEVAELLNKTALPELPSIPEPLKVEENFPEPSIVKSPDKKSDNTSEPSKSSDKIESKPTIFKTKTFFRSRHSRSQDAIGKYVAEQLNAERIDVLESDINGSEAVSSPEARESPPIDNVKVARLAPKIQLKKMKAEAAQLREKEKCAEKIVIEGSKCVNSELDNIDITLPLQDVIYPTQEIKPINKEIEKMLQKDIGTTEKINNEENKRPKEVHHDHEIIDNVIEETKSETAPILKSNQQKIILATDAPINITSFQNDIDVVVSPDNKGRKYGNKYQKPAYKTESTSYETSPRKSQEFIIASYCSPKKVPLEHKSNSPDENLSVQSPSKSPAKSDKVISSPKKTPTSTLQKSFEQMMTESTASAVDALLSVSREADRVPRIVSSGPPEDLFEDDHKDNVNNEEIIEDIKNNSVIEDQATEKNNSAFEEKETEKYNSAIEEQEPENYNSVIEEKETENYNSVIEEKETENYNSVIEEKEIENFTSVIEEQEKEQYNSVIQQKQEIIKETVEELNGLTNAELELDKDQSFVTELSITDDSNVTEKQEIVTDNEPTESDLQIAETLLKLPSTAIQNKNNDHQENLDIPMAVDNQHFDEIITESVVESDDTAYITNDNISNEAITPDLIEPNTESVIRYETEQEKSENLNAAQSLVQMSESVMDHNMVVESDIVIDEDVQNSTFKSNQNNGIDNITTADKKLNSPKEIISESPNSNNTKFDNSTSKLLKILEEPTTPKLPTSKTAPIKQLTPAKKVLVTGKEKILNFDVANSALKGKIQSPKQKIIIRRTGSGKSFINNLSDVVASPDKIILSRSNVSAQAGSSVQTFTIQASPDISTAADSKQIIIQPKLRKVPKPTTTKLQKIKPPNSLVNWSETKTSSEAPISVDPMYDINSMPVVLSDDILTPESIDKMPIVMSDGNLITNPSPTPPKLVKSSKPTILENEKVQISPSPSKPEVKTLLMNPASEVNKVTTTPNILSKSAKLRGAKPMLVIDKTTGKQKIIMTKGEPAVKEIKPAPTQQLQLQPVTQTATKTEKFIILPTGSSPRSGRAQKIVIDPQTGKAHVLVAKGQETQASAPDNKPVSAKLIPSSADASSPGNTVMIITNAQGAQSRIVLTPEHEKILFPNKQQPNVSQFKTITHRITTNAGGAPKTIVTAASPVKTPTKIVPKQQKSAIITSKGQLIVGGRVATSAQNIAPMPEIRPAFKQEIRPALKQEIRPALKQEIRPALKQEIRPALKQVPKRIVASEPKKLVQAIQKNASEPLIFLQQKSGAVMQLTAAQFEHLQRTGQIIQKTVPPQPENKIVVQKAITISPKESLAPVIQKQQRVRKSAVASPSPAKRMKHQPAVLPAPVVTHAPQSVLSVPHIVSPAPQIVSPVPQIVSPVPQIVSPVPPTVPPVPPLTSLSHSISTVTHSLPSIVPSVSETISVSTTGNYPDLDNFEELLPSTAIARQAPAPSLVPVPQPEPVVSPPAPAPDPPPAQLADGQLLAVPGENFGGPPGSFYLCVEDNGTLTPIDNRPLVLENNQLVPMEVMPVYAPQPERRDILEAALANSDVFHAEPPRDEAPDFRDLNANVSVHCRVSETSTTLNQPIMTPVEVPSNADAEPTVPSNLEDGLAVIGVTPHTVPTSLELPITVTDPRIAPKTTDPLSGSHYGRSLLTSSTEMSFATGGEEAGAAISMPLLTDDEAVGKSMPILTDEVAGSSVESAEDAWPRLRTPATDVSDASEASAEIPLQPSIQLSVNELSRSS